MRSFSYQKKSMTHQEAKSYIDSCKNKTFHLDDVDWDKYFDAWDVVRNIKNVP